MKILGSVYFVANEALGFCSSLRKKKSETMLLAERLLQNKAPYVQIQELGKQANWSGAAEDISGQSAEGSLSECNASGADPSKQINSVKVNQHCRLCLAVPK